MVVVQNGCYKPMFRVWDTVDLLLYSSVKTDIYYSGVFFYFFFNVLTNLIIINATKYHVSESFWS